jgi:hypothetical protein
MIQAVKFLIQVPKDVNQLLKKSIQRLKRLNQVLKKPIQGAEIAAKMLPTIVNSIIIRIGYRIVLNRRIGVNFYCLKPPAARAKNARR